VYPRHLFVLVSFPDKRVRQIKITDGGNAPFYGVYTANGDTVSAPQVPVGPAVMIFGDSWTGPTILEPLNGPTQPGLNGSGYPQTLGEFFNWNYWDNGIGGSGFTTVGTDSLGRTFVQRIQQELCPTAFQSVFILGGVNDSTNQAAEQTAVSQAISEIQACEAGSPIYLYGPQYGGQPQIGAAMAAVAANVTGTFSYKDIREANWFYGVNTDSSTGNAYLFFNGHPTPLGHDFLAEMFAMDLIHNYPSLMPTPYTLMTPAPLAGAYSTTQPPAMPSVGSYPVTVTFTPTDTSHFKGVTGTTTLTVTQATTTTNETVSLLNGTATLTATVAPQIAGVPTGTISFIDQSSGHTVASAPLSNGVATTQIALNTLTQGTHSVSANYSGDNNFLPSSIQTPVTFIASIPDFNFAFGQSQLTLTPGSSGTLPLTVTPLGGLTGALSVQCTGLPQNSACSLTGNPTLAAGVLTATLSVQAFTPTAYLGPNKIGPHANSGWWNAASGTAFCCLLGGVPLWRRRRTLTKFAALLALCALGVGGTDLLTGCGSGSAIHYATPGTYAVQVALTANPGTTTAVTHTQSITLTLP
jgi:lysophospholipase L1-like esterase